jgi:glutathione peroxidase
VNLWSKVKDESVEILAFPCNQFGSQEPDSDAKILQFARGKGVEFTMMSKINVNGPTASPVYKYLKRVAGPGAISWNFGTSGLAVWNFLFDCVFSPKLRN